MTTWLVALIVATALVLFQYGVPRSVGRATLAMALRWIAIVLAVALLLGAPAGRRRAPVPIVALDASASWTRGGDSAAWHRALQRFNAIPGDTKLLFGDSVRAPGASPMPIDRATLARPLVDRALAAGRPVVLLTDGGIDDPEALPSLPAGSRVEIVAPHAFSDVAVLRIEAPRSLVAGDTIEVGIAIASGAAGSPAGTLAVLVGDRSLARLNFDSLAPWAERRLSVRVAPAGNGPTVLRAITRASGDREPRNDTLATILELTRGATAVFVSTSPNEDSRFALSVLRGTLALPTRAYVQIAPGSWRLEGPLTPVALTEVREALRSAPIAVLHGDTAVFGAPRTLARGALALIPATTERGVDWYAIAAPASPLMGALGQLPWDSLPPLDVAQTMPTGDWVALTVARSRQLERRQAIVGSEKPRRTVVIGASGIWRWRFRGGASEPAFAALWGSIFDWLAAGRFDARAAVPGLAFYRAGDRITWTRGSVRDSMIRVQLSKRGASDSTALMLPFGGLGTAESPALASGIYDARTAGGSSLIAVNASPELLPRRPTVKEGGIGGAATPGDAPPLRDRMWPFVLLLVALCAEWLLRRRAGLR